MAITIEQVKQLREQTGAGVLDCRKALEQTNGDFNLALELLREKGLAKAAKRAEREASEGVVELYSHGNGRIGVMVEVNTETDFVARSQAFRSFAHEIALQIAAGAPRYIRMEEIPADELEQAQQKARAQKARRTSGATSIWPSFRPDFSDDLYDERLTLMRLAVDIDDRIEPKPFRPGMFTPMEPLVDEIQKHGLKLI